MDSTVWWVLLLVVGLLVGPFATLRAVSALRGRRGKPPSPAQRADDAEDEKRKEGGFW